jgi:hypothetical protein
MAGGWQEAGGSLTLPSVWGALYSPAKPFFRDFFVSFPGLATDLRVRWLCSHMAVPTQDLLLCVEGTGILSHHAAGHVRKFGTHSLGVFLRV